MHQTEALPPPMPLRGDPRMRAVVLDLPQPADCAGIDAPWPTLASATIGFRLKGLATHATGELARWREPFVRLAEILAVPGRFSTTSRIGCVADERGRHRIVSDLTITCFGHAPDSVIDEVLEVASQVEVGLGGRDQPFWIDLMCPTAMEWPTRASTAVLVRQSELEALIGDDTVRVPLPFTAPGVDAGWRLLDTILAFGPGLDLFVSLTPTTLRPDEERWRDAVETRLGDRALDPTIVRRRAVATALDAVTALRSDVFTVQVLIAATRPMADVVRQSLGAAITAPFDTERFHATRVVSRPDGLLGGGFEIEPLRDSARWLTALRRGWPILGLGAGREVRDLVSLAQVEHLYGWTGDRTGGLRGVPTTDSRTPVRTATPSDVRLGTDPFGAPVLVGGSDRHLHLVALGGTGSGKTTLMAACAAQDIAAGRAVIVSDPHGDLTVRVAHSVPPERRRDVVILDGTTLGGAALQYLRTYPAGSTDQELVEEGVVEGLTSDLNRDFVGPVFQRVVRAALRSARLNNKRISDVPRMFERDFDPVAAGYDLTDPDTVAQFRELASWSDHYRAEMLPFIAGKFNALQLTAMRETFDAADGLSLAALLERRAIILVHPGDASEPSRQAMGMFLGALLACVRNRRPADDTIGLYLDEAQLYSGGMLRRLMNEARKRAIAVHAATQTMTNLGSHFEAFAGNAGTLAVGRCAAQTAAFASGVLEVPVRVIERQPNLHFLVRSTHGGVPTSALACAVAPVAQVPTQWPEWAVRS